MKDILHKGCLLTRKRYLYFCPHVFVDVSSGRDVLHGDDQAVAVNHRAVSGQAKVHLSNMHNHTEGADQTLKLLSDTQT